MSGRKRSMKKDRNDDSTFRHCRERHAGMVVASEFFQPCPMFFTREGSDLNIIGHYRGASIFVICNGPSFVQLDHSQLQRPGVMTFGINNGPKTFRPNFWTCVDDPTRFLKSIWLDPRITKFVPQAHFEKKIFDNEQWQSLNVRVGECPNVIGYRRNEKFEAGRFLFEDSINWGNHKEFGGGRTVMLPALRIPFLLGFRKIYLLGCDLNMSESYTYHFDEKREKGAVNCNMNTYRRIREEYFPKLKPKFDEVGLEVYNCNPNSALEVFPYKSFEDAINESTAHLGDIDNERSYGMYSKPTDKDKNKEEPPQEAKINLQTLASLKENALSTVGQQISNQVAPEVQQCIQGAPCDCEQPPTPEVPTVMPAPQVPQPPQVTPPPTIKVNMPTTQPLPLPNQLPTPPLPPLPDGTTETSTLGRH